MLGIAEVRLKISEAISILLCQMMQAQMQHDCLFAAHLIGHGGNDAIVIRREIYVYYHVYHHIPNTILSSQIRQITTITEWINDHHHKSDIESSS